MSIFFLRHGQTDWNVLERCQGHTDIPLNTTGRKMIDRVSLQFKEEFGEIGYIISSPLLRAHESARIFSSNVGYKNEIIIEKMFIERCFGLAEGMVKKDIIATYSGVDIPEMEPEEEVFTRAMKALNHYVNMYTHENILIVTHGGVIKSLVNNQAEKNFVDLSPGGLFKMDMENGEYRIKRVAG